LGPNSFPTKLNWNKTNNRASCRLCIAARYKPHAVTPLRL
jgi:hypothetical protein